MQHNQMQCNTTQQIHALKKSCMQKSHAYKKVVHAKKVMHAKNHVFIKVMHARKSCMQKCNTIQYNAIQNP